ncbi:MAG: hypothetical protein WCF85_16015 [Rhodospirillaceae bacterium]
MRNRGRIAPFLAAAILFSGYGSGSGTARAESSLPIHSTFQTPPPESAEHKPGKTFLGVKMPEMPKMKMPDMPSLPDMLSTAGALPEKIGLPNANHIIDHQFERLVQKLNIAVPAVETLGYEVRNFEVDWTLPPTIKVRLQSSEQVTDEEYAFVLASVKGDLILESIVLSLNGVAKVQKASGLEPFKRAVIELTIGLPPHVLMTFSDPSNKFHERFIEHRAALQKAIAEAKARRPAAAAPTAPPEPAASAVPAASVAPAAPAAGK